MNFAVTGLKALIRMVQQAAAAKLSPIQALKTGRLGVHQAPQFLGQHTNPAGNARRKVKKEIGARQYRKNRNALMRAVRQDVIAAQVVDEVLAS